MEIWKIAYRKNLVGLSLIDGDRVAVGVVHGRDLVALDTQGLVGGSGRLDRVGGGDGLGGIVGVDHGLVGVSRGGDEGGVVGRANEGAVNDIHAIDHLALERIGKVIRRGRQEGSACSCSSGIASTNGGEGECIHSWSLPCE